MRTESWLASAILKPSQALRRPPHDCATVLPQGNFQVTKFDPEILDEPEDSETIRACDYEQPSDQIAGQELDYDSIMENARGHLDDKHEKISEPRQNLFSNSRTGSRNAC
jgi:hypothetical protein